MKTRLPLPPLLLAAALLLTVSLAPASLHGQDDPQENTSSSTTENSTGTVTAISPPLTITVDSRRGPFTYQLGPDLHVFGAAGRSVKVARVHGGDRVTVYYYKRLGQVTVARIVVLEAASKRLR